MELTPENKARIDALSYPAQPDTKWCPLRQGNCESGVVEHARCGKLVRTDCAFWISGQGECAVRLAARALDGIAETLWTK